MVCVVSPADLHELQLSISDLSLSQRKTLLYDYQGYLTNSPYQMVQIDFSTTLNLRCVTFEDTVQNVDFEVYYSQSEAGGCVNDCNGYNYPNTTDSVCVEEECHCLSGAFGWFCQFQSVQIQSNTPSSYAIDPGQWQYLSYQYASTALTFTSDNTAHRNISFSFVLKQSPQYQVPSLDDTMALTSSVNIQQYLISKESSTYVDVIYIGIINEESSTIDLTFQVLTEGGASEDNNSRNEIIIIVTGCVVGSLLLFAFFLSVLKSRQQRQFQIQIQEAIRRNLEEGVQNQERSPPPRQLDKNLKGFPLRFIQDHFKGHQYEKIIKVYPGLGQFEECVVCLESMKKGTTKMSKTCSVTPCFHMFHHTCLEEWLLRQKNCPFCRTDFTRKKLISQFPWLEVNTLRVNNTDSTYLTRMRNHENVNESQMNLVSQSQKTQLKEIVE